jgi:2-desacetyl-2-hydroxyethyl bacteriochlorophyllide A dehydrogenase
VEKAMKAALLLEPGKIAFDEVAEPCPGEGEVVLEPARAGLCGTDVSFYLGHRQVPYPFVLGHEVVGYVAALGKGVTKFKVGQRAVVEPNYPCGSCALCRKGRGAICPKKASMGVNLPGCFSDRAVAPAEFVWAVPETVSDEDAATIEPLAVSAHGLLLSGARRGDTVVILGCGVVGLLLAHAAAALGIRVIAGDRFPEKQEMALRLGAVAVLEYTDPARQWEEENVSTVFECAGVPATVDLALKAAPRGSQVMLLGLAPAPASFIPMRLVREGIDVRSSMIYDHPADFRYVIDLVGRGVLHPAQVVTHTFPFDQIGRALELAGTGTAGKIHIKMA